MDGQTLTLSGTGTLSSRNVGSQIPFATNGLSGFTLTGNGGASASNYTLAGGIDWVTITPLLLTLSATVQNKTYDTTTAAILTNLTISGLLAGDDVTFSYGTANFLTPNAGNNVPVLVGAIVGRGADLGNYSYSSSGILRGNILPVVLDLTGTRVYDGTIWPQPICSATTAC